MKKTILGFLFFSFLCMAAEAQFTRYQVKLKNKGGNPYSLSNPLAYLSQRSIDRRTRYGIAIDSTDLPVTPGYITQIDNIPNVTILNASKWLNSVTIQTNDAAAITAINALPFVQSVSGVAARVANGNASGRTNLEYQYTNLPAGNSGRTTADFFNYGTNAFNEMNLHKAQFLHNIGLRGQGMRMAVMDGGFFHYTLMNSLDSAEINGQFLDSFDFVAKQTTVWEDDSHGMSCLSTIAANIPGQFVGTAPKANFLLYRTENVSGEYWIEEHNWVCGAERADSAGADLITASLGYSIQFDAPCTDHPYSERNGDILMPAIGGDLAAKKGILVLSSIGNDGGQSGDGKYLSTASDGDSVLAIGAVNTSGVIAGFSSFGPSFDGQVKPDLVGVGASAVIQTSGNTIGLSNGTSFSCPKMAGMAACLWQGFPEFNNMRIRRALWQASNNFSTPNDRLGYGVPDLKAAFSDLLNQYSTASGSVASCSFTVNWSSKDMNAMRYEIERKLPGETVYTKVADIPATGGAVLSNKTYTFNQSVANIPAGTVSYRIRQVIDTNSATLTALYTDTVNITTAACAATGINPVDPTKEKVTLVPNPVAGHEVTVKVETPYPVGQLTIQITDLKGRTVATYLRNKTSGIALFTLPLQRLAKGKYIIAVYNGQKILATRELIRL